MCVKKFFGCFPSRTGSLVLAYVGIVTSIAVLIFFSFLLSGALEEYNETVKTGDYSLEYEKGEELLTPEEEKAAFALVVALLILIEISYFFVHGLFILFSILLAIGAHKNKRCLVKAYFIYGFFHIFFMLFLASLHFFMDEYVDTVLIVIADVIFVFCLCGVKGYMDGINSGQVYTQPGVVYKT